MPDATRIIPTQSGIPTFVPTCLRLSMGSPHTWLTTTSKMHGWIIHCTTTISGSATYIISRIASSRSHPSSANEKTRWWKSVIVAASALPLRQPLVSRSRMKLTIATTSMSRKAPLIPFTLRG
jgi:hypothetical protein